MSTAGRKDDHIRINLEEDVGFARLTTGFEALRFMHQALPECNFSEVDAGVTVFGKRLSAPLLVSSMTGGTQRAALLNRRLAQAAQERNLAMGVGSQRPALEDGSAAPSFNVREYAPDALLFANLGAVQLNYGYTVDHCRRAAEMIEADALILHLNPLQEVVQPEGDDRWAGLLGRIEQVCARLELPVIAKEVGWGISKRTAERLIAAGVSAIDVAGAGGTSWSEVEKHRATSRRQRRLAASFREWGISTADSLEYVREARVLAGQPHLPIIASGGMRSGQDVAKAAALGADLTGLASPFLKRAVESTGAVVEEMDLLIEELRVAMFASGCREIAALRREGVLVRESRPGPGAPALQVQPVLPSRRESTPPGGVSAPAGGPGGTAPQAPGREASSNPCPADASLVGFSAKWLPLLEEEMRSVLSIPGPDQADHYSMMHYHMGWADEGLQPYDLPAGKRVRPLFCLLACEAVGGDPANALHAAAAVEILHNFSLVHDDIEDGDRIRRHRPTIWALWGVPQAINVGDGMFSLAFSALLRTEDTGTLHGETPAAYADKTSLAAVRLFANTCVELTQGQHLDLRFEEQEDVSVADYFGMIEGKTAALIAASVALGALFGGADRAKARCLEAFGRNLGLAFQIRDDMLGIWGDSSRTGKAVGNDILRRKKSLPVLHALESQAGSSRFASLWGKSVSEKELPEILGALEETSTRQWCEELLVKYHQEALSALRQAVGGQAGGAKLLEFAQVLLAREK